MLTAQRKAQVLRELREIRWELRVDTAWSSQLKLKILSSNDAYLESRRETPPSLSGGTKQREVKSDWRSYEGQRRDAWSDRLSCNDWWCCYVKSVEVRDENFMKQRRIPGTKTWRLQDWMNRWKRSQVKSKDLEKAALWHTILPTSEWRLLSPTSRVSWRARWRRWRGVLTLSRRG